MKHFVFFLFLAGGLYACGGADAEGSASESSTSSSLSSTSSAQEQVAASTADGEQIYKQYCVACHGLYGDMGASGAFNLTTSTLTVDERVQVITKGRIGESGAAMQAFEGLLKPGEIEAVAEYTMTLSENAPGG